MWPLADCMVQSIDDHMSGRQIFWEVFMCLLWEEFFRGI